MLLRTNKVPAIINSQAQDDEKSLKSLKIYSTLCICKLYIVSQFLIKEVLAKQVDC